jgi:hypothetical protein
VSQFFSLQMLISITTRNPGRLEAQNLRTGIPHPGIRKTRWLPLLVSRGVRALVQWKGGPLDVDLT